MKKPVATPNMYFQGIVLERKKERKSRGRESGQNLKIQVLRQVAVS